MNQTETCPDCGNEVITEAECPRYLVDGQWMCCYPACGNATIYMCASQDCDWQYIDGLNPNYDGYAKNTEERPEWL